jgi:hypothetical protein
VTRPTKKAEERESLKAYLAAMRVSGGDGAIEEAERPDFLLTVQGVRIGVEVTDYHTVCNRREVEEHWRILRQWPMLLVDFPKYRSVGLHFRALRLPSRREVHDFVREVISLTTEPIVGATDIVIEPARSPVLAKYVSRMEVAPSKVPYLAWHWNHDTAWIGVTEEELMAIVAAKARSTTVPAASYWLMITGGATLSRVMAFIDHEWLEAMPLLTRQLEDGPFDRLVLLQSPIIEWRRDTGWQTVLPQEAANS